MIKVRGLRWYIITLIAVATVINYIDRSAINIMWPFIYKDFGIPESESKNALALITTFFMIAYAIGQTVMGRLMDRIGTRLGMVVSIALWSVATGLHAFAGKLLSFNAFRLLLGFSEAGNWPGATKNNAEWFPPKERGIAQGIFGAGASLGSVISAPAIAFLYLALGWQGTFLGIACLGLIWIVPWLIVNRAPPATHPWLTDQERVYIAGSEKDRPELKQEGTVFTLKELLGLRATWSIILGRFFIDPIWWMFVTWLPTFLREQFYFDVKQIGAFAWIPYFFAALGSLAGGWFAMQLIRKGICSAAAARRRAITIGCIVMLVSLGATAYFLPVLKDSAHLTMALISATLFGFQFLIGNLQTLPADYFNKKNVGAISGIGGTAAVVGTLFITWLVPVITKTDYVLFFVTGTLLVPCTWIVIKFLSPKYKQIK